ncbi:hypothetical protein F5I97DRAFT_1931318 [Phlebopus sp. FC_14]|nr:hypothetical protein F5I97DRAFT_1931318 [Phlebopus sp. FC_14]
MSTSNPDTQTFLEYIITHVFVPLRLPDGDDHSVSKDLALADAVCDSARVYAEHVRVAGEPQWGTIINMLSHLSATMRFETLSATEIVSQIRSMQPGNVNAFLIRSQNAAVIIRKHELETYFESFEASPSAGAVMNARGKLVCSYPGPAVAIPNNVFNDSLFQTELANFLVRMNEDVLDAAQTSRKAGSTVVEERDTTHPRYITELLTGVLRGLGRPVDIQRVTKRIGDDVVWNNSRLPWRRSPLWLVIRVALQTSLQRGSLAPITYKAFMLFFMHGLTLRALREDLSNELLHFMSAKLSHRVMKLGSSIPDWLSQSVHRACADVRKLTEDRWRRIQAAQAASPHWCPAELNLSQDTQLSLLGSRGYIHDVLMNRSPLLPRSTFRLNHHRRGTIDEFLDPHATFFTEAYASEALLTLRDFERAIEVDVDTWVSTLDSVRAQSACESLEMLSSIYAEKALETYKGNPENLSIMLLTLLELWVALDMIAVKAIPLLAEYSPEVPETLLHSLLLRTTSQLRRLQRAHEYLRQRHSKAKKGFSVFSSKITHQSFAVRYFWNSSPLQNLKSRIEQSARQDRASKLEELAQANARYAKLEKDIEKIGHSYNIHGKHKAKKCPKCKMEKEKSAMTIPVHEWPLPADPTLAIATVFELECPVTFNMWRSATCHFIIDICSPKKEPASPYIILDDYAALKSYHKKHPRSRITLASDTKPVQKTHYNPARIPGTEGTTCFENGLALYPFDQGRHLVLTDAFQQANVSHYCTYVLPAGAYENLHGYLASTLHSSNDVHASQAMCSPTLSIHEFIAFGHLRSGPLLQWLNILRELRDRTLSFRREEIHLLIAQAVLQVGPLLNAGYREWHTDIHDVSFCTVILSELESLVMSVEANWLEATTMKTVALIASCILAPANDKQVLSKACALLRNIREKTFAWVKELSSKLASIHDTNESEELRQRLLETAAICRSTYDVGIDFVGLVLQHPRDIEILVCCSIIVHDNIQAGTPTTSNLLLDRDRRLSWTLESTLFQRIESHPKGLDEAITHVWSAYRRCSKWQKLKHPNSRWLQCHTSDATGQGPQQVNYNLLSGSLLIDGKPLGRLPDEIVQHPLYLSLFGKCLMLFLQKAAEWILQRDSTVSGLHVYFAMKNERELIIRAIADSSWDVLELLPPYKLASDLPVVLVEDQVHWLNLNTKKITILPRENLWMPSAAEHWEVDVGLAHYSARKGSTALIDVRSRTSTMISNLISPLERPQNILVTVGSDNQGQRTLSVHLPRYGLSFFVNENGELQSCNLRDMVIDSNQSAGTLFGLVNQLVLRPKSRLAETYTQRCVLIPEGRVSCLRHGHHVRIVVDTEVPLGADTTPDRVHLLHRRVPYQTYRIDTHLGCLSANAGLTNRLYKAYLHALSSGSPVVDPLTGKTGTEEALDILRSASCRSFMKTGSVDREILHQIASLTTKRMWYPAYLKHMQQVNWGCIPIAAQHHGFRSAAENILRHAEQLQVCRGDPKSSDWLDLPGGEVHLTERAAIRASILYPQEFIGPLPLGDCDIEYESRDRLDGSDDECRAYNIAYGVYSWAPRATLCDILKLFQLWGKATGMQDDLFLRSDFSHRYTKEWLQPSLPEIWIPMYDLLRKSDKADHRFQLLFSLPAMAYSSSSLETAAWTFLAFATEQAFRSEKPPPHRSPLSDVLCAHISAAAYEYHRSPEALEFLPEDSPRNKDRRTRYSARLEKDKKATAASLTASWPYETCPSIQLDRHSYNLTSLQSVLDTLFKSCYHNLQLRQHLSRVQSILRNTYTSSPASGGNVYTFKPCVNRRGSGSRGVSLTTIFKRPAPIIARVRSDTLYDSSAEDWKPRVVPAEMAQLITGFRKESAYVFQQRYAEDLQQSLDHFSAEKSHAHRGLASACRGPVLQEQYNWVKKSYHHALATLEQHLAPRNTVELAVFESGKWPRLTPQVFFSLLASSSPTVVNESWRKTLISLVLIALELQRSRRLLDFAARNCHEEFFKELENEGCEGWDAECHPDWLLIQLEGNFLVRGIQADVAFEMICPRSNENTALQLNMGEGKSSVIIPIVVVALASGDQLVRVVVPKALTAQMFHLLVERISGLTNRRVYYLPFSRSVGVGSSEAASLHRMMEECKREGGVLVAQPDHILSLKLMSVEKQLDHSDDIAGLLLQSQRWLHSHARDILDESDEILHVRYQLVYTIGRQKHLDGFPERWTTTQQILNLLRKHVSSLYKLFPCGLEFENGDPWVFPHTRILRPEAGKELIARLTRDVIRGMLPNFSFVQARPRLRQAIHNFISVKDVSASEVEMVEQYSKDSILWNGLLHLRGLLSSGILLFALRERRWRVDYGLAPHRTMLAVPYRAKDIPAPRAEFGHPDVAITLTCLSYYYGGLTRDQLMLCFQMLLKQDNPTLEYESWILDCPAIPDTLRRVSGINTKSSEQWKTVIFPLFSRNQAVVDFYLSRVVFPKEAKEFPSKLSCSGWDLAETKDRVTTGFSGTNDGRYLLPTSITQRDPDHQRSTNAKVLAYLLHPENNRYQQLAWKDGTRRTVQEFLKLVVSQEPEIRVLLDVGAQMLELQNNQLAAAWLELKTDAQAAIYVDDDDELIVLTRDGTTRPLASSPFAEQLDQCVAYLDDAHTRGTDIRFPTGFRAAVTLGPRVTKDRLMQGCMRMRKLGHGHSVMFFAPLEVDRHIRSAACKSGSDPIYVVDILRWTILETCDDIQRRASHWVQQGIDHSSRYRAWSTFCQHDTNPTQLASAWLQPEAKSLEELYSPRYSNASAALTVPEIQQRCARLGIKPLADCRMDEEQEREVIHEIERERQVERPPKVEAAIHKIDKDVIHFVRVGSIPGGSTAFVPIFHSLRHTSAAFAESHVWTQRIFATADFCKTVVVSQGKADDYLRPVNWILSTRNQRPVWVVLSPFEVNALLPQIRESKTVHLHMYTARTSKSMKPCDDLKLYIIPPLATGWSVPVALMDQLNVFAGQLYLRDYATYIRLCRFLCIYSKDVEHQDVEVQSDGFIAPRYREVQMQMNPSFQRTPMRALKNLVSLRRKGMRYEPTHMGKMLDGRLLTEEDFRDE